MANWKIELLNWTKSQLSQRFPKHLVLPTGKDGDLFELGGANEVQGIAVVVGSPSGGLPTSKVLHPLRPNEIHALVKVWPQCTVMVATHDRGNAKFALYRVKSFRPQQSRRTQNVFQEVILEKVCETSGNHQITDSSWVQPAEELGIVQAREMYKAAKTKVFMYNCTEALYVESFIPTFRTERLQVFDSLAKLQSDQQTPEMGLYDPVNTPNRVVLPTIEKFLKRIETRCNELFDKYDRRYIWPVFVGMLTDTQQMQFQCALAYNNKGYDYDVELDSTMYEFSFVRDDFDQIQAYLDGYGVGLMQNLFGQVENIFEFYGMLQRMKRRTNSTIQASGSLCKWKMSTMHPDYYYTRPNENPSNENLNDSLVEDIDSEQTQSPQSENVPVQTNTQPDYEKEYLKTEDMKYPDDLSKLSLGKSPVGMDTAWNEFDEIKIMEIAYSYSVESKEFFSLENKTGALITITKSNLDTGHVYTMDSVDDGSGGTLKVHLEMIDDEVVIHLTNEAKEIYIESIRVAIS
jgi:hypothetical protein